MYGVVLLLRCYFAYISGQNFHFDSVSSMRLVKIFGLDKTRLSAAQRAFGEAKHLVFIEKDSSLTNNQGLKSVSLIGL